MPAPPPLVANRYELTELLGRGGMADVHRARDRVLGRDVALKLLREVNDVDVERFRGEARMLARLADRGIVQVLDAGVDGSLPWLALELVEGRTLAAVMAGGPLAPEDVVRLIAPVARGLATAHAAGVVHRDVKPANILVTADDRSAKLTDFGIARLIDATAHLTVTGTTIGTAAYLAPEQVRGDHITGAADVYALGLLLLEALTAQRAYPGPAVEAALARLTRQPLIPTSLPPGWSGLIAAMTAADPTERPDASFVAQRLGELRSHQPTQVLEVPPSYPHLSPRRALLATGALVGVLLVGSVAAAIFSGGEPAVATPDAPSASTPASGGSKQPAPAATTRPPAAAPATQDSDVTADEVGSASPRRQRSPPSTERRRPRSTDA